MPTQPCDVRIPSRHWYLVNVLSLPSVGRFSFFDELLNLFYGFTCYCIIPFVSLKGILCPHSAV